MDGVDHYQRIESVLRDALGIIESDGLSASASSSNNMALEWMQTVGMFKMLLPIERKVLQAIAPWTFDALCYRLSFKNYANIEAEIADGKHHRLADIAVEIIPELEIVLAVTEREQRKASDAAIKAQAERAAAEHKYACTCKFCGKVLNSPSGRANHSNKCEADEAVWNAVWTDYKDVNSRFWFDLKNDGIIRRY